jgi:hypothetical protein
MAWFQDVISYAEGITYRTNEADAAKKSYSVILSFIDELLTRIRQ